MKKLVILKFDGNIDSELHVTLEIANDGERAYRTITGKLPGNNTITPLLDKWHDTYRSRYGQFRIKAIQGRSINIQSLNQECEKQSRNLLENFNFWLSSASFYSIVNCLKELKLENEIRIIITTSCHELRQLPWHLWDVLIKFPLVEVALSSPNAERGERPYREKIRILIILGDAYGGRSHRTAINIDADKQYLQSFCGNDAEIILLQQPSREELNHYLQDNLGWDMLFFSGHSQTQGMQGRIYLNDSDSLTMAELRDALQVAITRRLQIAFFNSCDGLGIAYELEQLNIPQVIVMRLPVPDKVAQEFLKYFLQEFTGGKSLYISVRNARLELQKLESEFPCASWLPVIVQNQTETPPTWQSLGIISFCPYQGLEKFTEEKAKYFFGRDRATSGLVAAVNNKPLVAVIGASGSGKSSLVFAGLIPQLRGDIVNNWVIINFRPGKNLFESLAVALVSALNLPEDERRLVELELDVNLKGDRSTLQNFITDLTPLPPFPTREGGNKNFLLPSPRRGGVGGEVTRVLLIADQFEEIYTLCTDAEERKTFLDSLLQAVKNAPFFTLVLTLRADFLSRALDDYEPFGRALQEYQLEPVVRMSREELEEAITRPATQLGFEFEQGLSNTIINDIQDGDGRLPLLEFTLTQLWKQQYSGRLTHQAYKNIGGVEKALANYAEAVYADLSEWEREKAQRVFIQLVQPGEGTEDTRKLATSEEVGGDNWDLVTRLADKRLVVTNWNESINEDTVEVVHEALIRHWGRLRGWMQENRKFRIWQQGLIVALQQWVDSNRDDGALLRGAPLAVAEDWLQQRGGEVREAQRWFIENSVKLREREKKQRKRLRQRVIGGLVCGLVLALGLAGIAMWREQEAQIQATNAYSTAASLSVEKLLSSNNDLEALVEAVKAGKKLRQSSRVQPDTRIQTVATLTQVVYTVKLRNRLEYGENGSFEKISFSPDGKIIASASGGYENGTFRLWNLEGKILLTLKGDDGTSNHISFSPDGKTIATASAGQINLWNLQGKRLLTFKGDSDAREVHFSPNGKILASVSYSDSIKLWSLDGKLLQTLLGSTVNSMSFGSDGKAIASASGDKTIKLQNLDGILKTLLGSKINSMSFSSDSKAIASASYDGTIRLWNLEGKLLQTFKGHSDIVQGISFSPDSKIIASASNDGTIRLWNLEGKLLQIFKSDDSSALYDVSFSPNGKFIASAGSEGKIKIWNLTGKLLLNFKGHSNNIQGISFSPDGKIVASASWDGTIKLWNLYGEHLQTFQGDNSAVSNIRFSPNGKFLVGAGDKTIKLWNSQNKQLQIFKGHNSDVYAITFSADSQILASGSEDGIITLWNLKGEQLQSFKGHSSWLTSLSFSPDGKVLASGSHDGNIKLWNLKGKLLRTIEDSEVKSVSFNPNGKTLASVGWDSRIKLWNLEGKQLQTIGSHGDSVDLSFSSDGKIIASASDDGTVKLWKLGNKLPQTLRGHNVSVKEVSFNPDGKTLASASLDGTIKLWSLEGRELKTLKSDRDGYTSVSFSPDGKILASASGDKEVILWNFDLDDLLEKGCDWLHGYLQNNPNVSQEDKRLCDDIKPIRNS